jgi:hypothetical protein
MKRTYVDSGVLIAAARGSGTLAERALSIISDTEAREFVCSDYVKLDRYGPRNENFVPVA